MGDGAVIHVAAGATLARPIHLVFVNSRRAAGVGLHPLARRDRARARARCWSRAMRARPARLSGQHRARARGRRRGPCRPHQDHRRGRRRAACLVADGGDRRACALQRFLFTTGGAVVRNQLFVRFDGEGTIAGIRGASLLKGRQHADTTLVVDHAAGGCNSREVFKTVLDDESRGVFQGKIIVRPQAQKTDAKMTTHALLLSDDGRGRQQAGAGDLRRRRAVRPRRDLGRARRGPAVLSDGARHSGEGGRGAADPGLRRRGDRGHRACRAARRADGARRRPG